MQPLTDATSAVQLPRSSRPPQLKAITSLRFFAALYVATYHFVRPFSQWGAASSIFQTGYVGVSFFFFLSGFILTYTHTPEYEAGHADSRGFWFARFARIYPVYLVSLLIAGYLGAAQFHPAIHVIAYISDIFLMQSWYTRLTPFFHTTAWSLSDEAFFYLVFPFLLMWLRPRTRTRALISLGILWLLAIAPPLLAQLAYPGIAVDGSLVRGSGLAFALRRVPIFALPEFLAGISLGWLYVRFRPPKKIGLPLAVAGIAGFLVAVSLSNHLPSVTIHNGLLLPLFAMIILGLSEDHWLSRALSVPPLLLLGEASYALYLIHYLFDNFAKERFGAADTLGSLWWRLSIAIALALILCFGVERPARRKLLQWWKQLPRASSRNRKAAPQRPPTNERPLHS